MADKGLKDILYALREYPGLTRKAAVGDWARSFAALGRARLDTYGPGDDAGAVRLGDGFLLLSCEGIWSPLLDDPWFAGFASVSVNVNDMYAMGGRPLGIVATVFAGGITPDRRESFIQGMTSGLEHYGVPMLGGHTSPEADCSGIAVCIAGRASKLMRGDGARAGHKLLAALDLEGRRRDPFHAWDSVTSADRGRTMGRLQALVELAELGVVSACRDISNPGILGTFAMMLESSGAGARIDLDPLPVPGDVDMEWWLEAYPSFGFALAARPEDLDTVLEVLDSHEIEHAVIGEAVEGSSVQVGWKGESAEFIDWKKKPVTGLYAR